MAFAVIHEVVGGSILPFYSFCALYCMLFRRAVRRAATTQSHKRCYTVRRPVRRRQSIASCGAALWSLGSNYFSCDKDPSLARRFFSSAHLLRSCKVQSTFLAARVKAIRARHPTALQLWSVTYYSPSFQGLAPIYYYYFLFSAFFPAASLPSPLCSLTVY